MNKLEEKMIYRLLAQKEGITITAETKEMTMEEAKATAIAEVLVNVDKTLDFQPFVALPVTTQERWDAGCINFCPRCGTNLSDYELDEYANTDCHSCDASLDIHVQVYDSDEDE